MASSAHNQHQLLSNLYGGATSAPPPTPSTSSNNLLSTSDTADALSRLLHRLPPNLSLPIRRRSSSSSAAVTCPPSFSLSSQTANDLLNSVSQLGFAQLTDHPVPSQLAESAESEALALFDLPRDQKESFFPAHWPLGYDNGVDDDGDEHGHGESFRFDSSCSAELPLASLREFTCELEKLGFKIIDMLTNALGIENPADDDPTRLCPVMWISECLPETQPDYSGFYPFIVGLEYQIRCQKCSLLSDSGRVSVLPTVDSILVTLGDIAQVWSNGKLKKVRGRPVPTVGGDENGSRCITMSLLITLPTESIVAPLLPNKAIAKKDQEVEEEVDVEGEGEGDQERVFNSFDFEDYAWRFYHERLHFKDPLDRYRVAQKF